MQKIKVMLIFSLTLILNLLVIFINGQKIPFYLDTGLMIVLFGAFLMSLLLFSWQDIRQLFAALDGKRGHTQDELIRCQYLLRTVWSFQVHIVILMYLVSSVAGFYHATQMRYIGSWIAVILLNAIYLTAMRWLFFQPAEVNLSLKLEQIA